MTRRGAAQAGFTLVELLVATTLLALMATAMFGGLRFGSRVWETTATRVEWADRLRTIQSVLRARVAEARPGSLVGDAASLRFVAPAPRQFGGEPYVFALERDAQAAQLVLTLAPAGGGDAERRALVEGVARAAFSYFGDPEGEGRPAWRNDWPQGAAPPRLVAVDVTFPAGDGRRWPRLIVRPRLDPFDVQPPKTAHPSGGNGDVPDGL